MKLRIPRWCEHASISINGATPVKVAGGQFHALTRSWKPGDRIELTMPMTWRAIRGRKSQAGRAAIMRGPTIFAFNPERNAELCLLDPGFDVDLSVRTSLRTLTEIWMGDRDWLQTVRKGELSLEGDRPLTRGFHEWLDLSGFARVERMTT